MSSYPYPEYKSREERNQYCVKLLNNSFPETKSILNIGGGQKRHFKDSKFSITEIDIDGDNDLTLDLDKISRIPLEDKSFDTVICLDVLEHLENFHLIVDEMNRLSKKNIIISLPNCFHSFFDIILNKRNKDEFNMGYYNKFYGLPLKKPKDRHRWFFSMNDVERFFLYYSKINNLKCDFILPRSHSIKSQIFSFFLNKRLKKEILTKYAWIILNK